MTTRVELDRLLCAALLAIPVGPEKAEAEMRKFTSALDGVFEDLDTLRAMLGTKIDAAHAAGRATIEAAIDAARSEESKTL